MSSALSTEANAGAGKKVLLLGAGMCSRPIIHYLDSHGYHVLVASRTLAAAQGKVKGTERAEALELDITSEAGEKRLAELVPGVEAVVSLLPYVYHPKAAKVAIAQKKHFLTASYTSDAMRELTGAALDAGVVVVNECGVDPGTDHMSAMRIINRVHKEGGALRFFTSYAGGLPAAECNDNPFGYKFSWAPRGVLLAGKNSAHFYRGGEEEHISGEDLFRSYWSFSIEGFPQFEVYPNRTSLPYREIYGIPEVKTLIRGTLRHKGWCEKVKKLVDLGWIEETERSDLSGRSYASVTAELAGADGDASGEKLEAAVASKLGVDAESHVLSGFRWLGLFDAEEKVPADTPSTLDALCALMRKKMTLKAEERDLMLLRHTMQAEFKNRIEHITSTLVAYGESNGDTAMARTTSLPLAIATRLVLEGKFTTPGLSIPIIPELYDPILDELARLGIAYEDKIVVEKRPQVSKQDRKEIKKAFDDQYMKSYAKYKAKYLKKYSKK